MKRVLLLCVYTLFISCTFHLTTDTEFPLPIVTITEVVKEEPEIISTPITESDYTITLLGTPFKDRYSESQLVSRNPWDIKVFDNKIFVGCGDYDKNTGPTDIMYYDLEEKVWVNSGTVDDEAVAKFLVIDDKLTVPGIDPRTNADFSFGNYYVYDDSGWETLNNIPNAAHTFDIEIFQGETFYAIGTSKSTQSPVQKTDDGQTFTEVQFLKDGDPITETESFPRCYALFATKDKLFAFCRWTNSRYYGFFEYDDNAFNLVSENPPLEMSQEGINRQSLINEHVVFNNKCYFSLGTLYSTDDFENFEKIDVPKNAYVQDILVKENKMFVLTSESLETPENATENATEMYQNTVWEYSEKNGFKKILTFEYDTTAMSFDISGDSFYIGMGSNLSPADQNGSVYEFKANIHD